MIHTSGVHGSLPPLAQGLLRDLLSIWLEFERGLGHVPILRRLQEGRWTREDYKSLLRNLRPQVVEGSRWIARAASSFSSEHLELRSLVLRHAVDEHRDYEMLEQDYEDLGGSREELLRASRNIGTDALAGYLMEQATLPNPIRLAGALFMIEGLGEKMASGWARRIDELLGLGGRATRFLSSHGGKDVLHIERFQSVLGDDLVNEASVPEILKTARVVSRLYQLQLEELDHV